MVSRHATRLSLGRSRYDLCYASHGCVEGSLVPPDINSPGKSPFNPADVQHAISRELTYGF